MPLHAPRVTGDRVRIDLYAQCWNDEFMLPYFFRHYDDLVQRYVIFDEGSTDGTLSILSGNPKVEIRRFTRQFPDSFVLSEQALSNECWKESRGAADWVIVTDIDEHLYHPRLAEYLREIAAQGVTLVPALGFQMISDEPPQSGDRLCDVCTQGAPWRKMMKASVFDPAAIQEIRFATGRHQADPIGNVRVPDMDQLILLHYKYLGFERTWLRHLDLARGLGPQDVENTWGHKYSWPPDRLREDWDDVRRSAVDVAAIRDNPSPAYTAERWWNKYRKPGDSGIAERRN